MVYQDLLTVTGLGVSALQTLPKAKVILAQPVIGPSLLTPEAVAAVAAAAAVAAVVRQTR